MPRVVVVGPCSWNTLVQLDELPPRHTATVFAANHHDGLGGTSAGTAVTLAALGVDVVLCTVLGADAEAEAIRAALAHPRITLLDRPAVAGRSERHVNLMARDERVSIYLELPAVEDPDVVDPRVLDALAGADAAVVDLADHARPVLAAARSLGVPVWCDVHDDDGVADYQRPFAAAADVLQVSTARLPDPAAHLRAAVERGARLAVATRGSAGALAADADGLRTVGSPAVDVVDTNGAGDAFGAGLLAAHLAGLGTAEALAAASACGALAVGTAGLGAPHATWDQVRALAAQVEVSPPTR
ncbi:MAG: carbohydrate kinase family protein [Actinomycetales bacterium]|nr:carbohydrate kinase family protein [Actinomycetales bacterium]